MMNCSGKKFETVMLNRQTFKAAYHVRILIKAIYVDIGEFSPGCGRWYKGHAMLWSSYE